MDCQAARTQIDLDFGADSHSAELVAHIESCDACRAYCDELDKLCGDLGADLDFGTTAAELERNCEAVEAKLDRLEIARIGDISWIGQLVRVAAVLLVVGASFGVGRLSSYQQQTPVLADWTMTSELALTLAGDLVEEELDEQIIRSLIDDYSDARYFEAGESLLGDISLSEMEYLMKNFEIGDLL